MTSRELAALNDQLICILQTVRFAKESDRERARGDGEREGGREIERQGLSISSITISDFEFIASFCRHLVSATYYFILSLFIYFKSKDFIWYNFNLSNSLFIYDI